MLRLEAPNRLLMVPPLVFVAFPKGSCHPGQHLIVERQSLKESGEALRELLGGCSAPGIFP